MKKSCLNFTGNSVICAIFRDDGANNYIYTHDICMFLFLFPLNGSFPIRKVEYWLKLLNFTKKQL